MRLLYIFRMVRKYNLPQYLPKVWWAKLFTGLFFWQAKHQLDNKHQGLRLFLQELGPVFIKLGQLISIRRDLIPEDLADELKYLQDAVAPMEWQQAELVLIDGLGLDYKKLFKSIETEPLAAASVAQVHYAVKSTSEKCVVKIIRPGLSKIIKQDLALATILAKLLAKLYPASRRLKLLTVIKDYDCTIHDELNLSKEAANMSQVKRNFANSDLLYVAAVDWARSCDTVLTMEAVSGVQADDIKLLKKLDFDLKLLAERGVEIFFTQVFKHNFFHADMHPGNIFIDTKTPKSPKYIAVDFGIMGSLSNDDQYYLAVSLLAFFNNDYANLAQAYIGSGWVKPNTNHTELTSAFRTVLEPYLGKPIAEISLGHILLKLFKISGNFGMEIQPQLVLLDKTLLYIEGLGRQIYPELDLWNTAKPFIEKWLSSRIGFKSFITKTKKNLPEFIANLPDKPIQIYHILDLIKNGELTIKQHNYQLEQDKTNQAHKRLCRNMLAGFNGLAAVLLFGQNQMELASLCLGLAVWFYVTGNRK